MFYKSLLFIFLGILFSCQQEITCPPDIKHGDFEFEPGSADFLPYSGISSLTFRDSAHIHTAKLNSLISLNNERAKLLVGNICNEGDARSDHYYSTEHLTVYFSDVDTSEKFAIIGNVSIEEDFRQKNSTIENPILFDQLKLTVHRANPSLGGAVSTIEHVLNTRQNDSNFSDTLKARVNRFIFVPQISILDTFFSNVFIQLYLNIKTGKPDTAFVYKSGEGVLAFKDHHDESSGKLPKWWVLFKRN